MLFRSLTISLLCTLLLLPVLAQQVESRAGVDEPNDMTWTAESVGPERFIAVHGRGAAVMGYPASGLEVWAYPLQLVSNYRVSFLPKDQTQRIAGEQLLQRIVYRPDGVERVYVGSDFIVHERIFVPLHAPGAIFTYAVEGRGDVSVQIRFDPSLNLMWPGALGGQHVAWDPAISGYVITEPLYGFSGKVASQEAIAHDAPGNPAIQTPEQAASRTLILQPKSQPRPQPGSDPKSQPDGTRVATLFIGYDAPHTPEGSGILPGLRQSEAELHAEVARSTQDLLATALQIETPDAELNRALAWSVLALDQAWVCNPSLGCGEVAGYGPSRPGRRPQYDWFFAGDGLVAVNALIDLGEYDRAREELSFISRYQSKSNGMIWHELSQSAALLDWEAKYPYMYVHVDMSFDYLKTVDRYVQASGDTAFLKASWSGIQAAYHYCTSLIDPGTKLPVIPAGKEGANEQDRMRDDLGLSSAWVAAAESFAQMSQAMRSPESTAAAHAAEQAREAMAANSWNAVQHFWVGGHFSDGKPVDEQRAQPTAVLNQHVFSEAQREEILDRIASPEFQTDWGTRILSSASSRFDPNSYSAGSVSALGTAAVATSFWQQHRPVTAWQIWHGLLAWNRLDSEGHLHEVLAGDFYHPEIESVPEQTWSSAGYVSAAVQGLLGLSVVSGSHQVTFAPHLPAQWNQISVSNVRVGAASLDFRVSRSPGGLTLHIVNRDAPVSLTFSPEIPLGASLGEVKLTSAAGVAAPMSAKVEVHAQDQHATLSFVAETGTSDCYIPFTGGVQVELFSTPPLVGASSQELKVRSARFANQTLTVDASVNASGPSTLRIVTGLKPSRVEGGRVLAEQPDGLLLEIDKNPPTPRDSSAGYEERKLTVRF